MFLEFRIDCDDLIKRFSFFDLDFETIHALIVIIGVDKGFRIGYFGFLENVIFPSQIIRFINVDSKIFFSFVIVSQTHIHTCLFSRIRNLFNFGLTSSFIRIHGAFWRYAANRAAREKKSANSISSIQNRFLKPQHCFNPHLFCHILINRYGC